MEENTNPQQLGKNQPPQSKPVQKDGLLPGQEQEDELNLIGETIFGITGM